MKILSLAIFAACLSPATAAASEVTIGAGFAESCYRAAAAHESGNGPIEACDRALAEQLLGLQDRVATLVNRGILHMVRANPASADADFDAALALDPNQADAWLNKAVLQLRTGKAVDALPMVQRAIDLKTRRPALAYFVRAMAHEQGGNIRAAYEDLKRAQALEPGWKDPQIELRRFQVRRL